MTTSRHAESAHSRVGGLSALLLAAAACVQPANAQSWTGVYVGGTAGLQISDADWRTTSLFPTLPAPFIATPDASASRNFSETDWRFGAFAGANWQVSSNFLVGLEFGIGHTLDSSNPKVGIPGAPLSVPGFVLATANDRLSVATDWDATIRGRLGMLVTPSTLAYVSGGVAFQNVVMTASCVGNPGTNVCFNSEIEKASTTRTGWTIGGGVEQALGGNLFARVDYAYADLGRFSHTFFRGATSTAPLFDDQITGRIDLVTHTVNVGLAYKF